MIFFNITFIFNIPNIKMIRNGETNSYDFVSEPIYLFH